MPFKSKKDQRAYNRAYYKANSAAHYKRVQTNKRKLRALITAAKDKPCADCQKCYPHYVMDFDHRVDEVKLFNLGNSVNMIGSADRITAEIEKCDVVCANCHRIRTHGS